MIFCFVLWVKPKVWVHSSIFKVPLDSCSPLKENNNNVYTSSIVSLHSKNSHCLRQFYTDAMTQNNIWIWNSFKKKQKIINETIYQISTLFFRTSFTLLITIYDLRWATINPFFSFPSLFLAKEYTFKYVNYCDFRKHATYSTYDLFDLT